MNTVGATRLMRRLALPAVLVAGVVLYVSFGVLRVPRGMDTMPETHPGGTICVIDKRPGPVSEGWVVFVDLSDGASVLTRVAAVHDDGSFEIRHDNRQSKFGYLERLGPYPASSVRGQVLSAFTEIGQGEPDLGK